MPGDVRIEDVPQPTPGPGRVKVKVKVKVAYNGIYGSDLHEYYDPQVMVSTTPHPPTGACGPTILGHKAAGTIVDLGEGVTELSIGDLVAIEPIWACETCAGCLRGEYNLCPRKA